MVIRKALNRLARKVRDEINWFLNPRKRNMTYYGKIAKGAKHINGDLWFKGKNHDPHVWLNGKWKDAKTTRD